MVSAVSPTFRVAPFDCSSFTNSEFRNPPPMSDEDTELFHTTLQAKNAVELSQTARIWENNLLPEYPSPFFLVRVGDIRASLGSLVTALELYEEAQSLVNSDPVFNGFLAQFEYECMAAEENHRSCWSKGVFNQPWNSANQLRFPILPRSPESMPLLQQKWASMRSDPRDLAPKFLRYLCIESAIFEDVFLLKNRSFNELVCDGFTVNAVECSPESPLQERYLIAEVLRDTHKALEMVLEIADTPDKLTVEFICAVHAVCMKTSRILPLRNADGELEIKYVNAGVTRQTSRKNVMIPGPPRVQFCPFEDVLDELRKFTNLARQWLRNWDKNPFATAAWLHLVFTSCHPFEDGNGRVARMIASIPLVRAGLPPLCIPSSCKQLYFEGLHKARENKYEPLVKLFAQAQDISLRTVSDTGTA